mmetsp:Transcript_15885/g.20887  ORF Transcript_15885/g.20887 Transcript_15885/m.20887 type:complete len:261 (-) Transcript_15885:56-838(-)|eukprot:CAMPEP_0197307898 /NCGR_PEP_ID=MMETSP0891-20130614/6028_1 /TAXON_ID=44058 ORGANISM="Aureoumbra lagunensis, Strain CCMP1510" /NCGR_SAMPLE_ID=MMETSP0891 /ASSEMBLY_ACC=CAM_ASM_000534 /LENGTH=260 /DNA_ID=CAMNT_0042791799 /DNA_START=108 /DNA_END=890 /DNA_ORIENTATION=-
MASGYDLSPTTFSPDGRIFQVEYAAKAVENSGTVVGVRCSDGVVLAVENIQLTKMLVKGSNRRSAAVDGHAGLAIAGMAPDGRQLINRAREECSEYSQVYGIPMPPRVLAQRLAEYIHYFTLHGALRPFGASAVLTGYDKQLKTHELYVLEPSGLNLRYYGASLGKGRQSCKSDIEKLDLSSLSCKDALKEIAKMIYTVYDESKDKPFVLEMAWLTQDTNFEFKAVPQNLIDQAEAQAKAELADDDDDDDDEPADTEMKD